MFRQAIRAPLPATAPSGMLTLLDNCYSNCANPIATHDQGSFKSAFVRNSDLISLYTTTARQLYQRTPHHDPRR